MDAVRVERLELLSDGLELLRIAASNRPLQIGGQVLHNVLAAEATGVTGWTEKNYVVLSIGGHGGWWVWGGSGSTFTKLGWITGQAPRQKD